MAGAKTRKVSNKQEEVEHLKTEIASFAASIGLSSSAPSSGFDDTDFRKTGSLQSNELPKKPKQAPEKISRKDDRSNTQHRNSREKPRPKPPVLSLEDSTVKSKGFDKFKNLPKLPLIRASALGVWYADAAELEAKVIGEQKRVGAKNVEEWKRFVEKKREIGERLMAQYTRDYESSRGQSGDIKMLITTQRSGTAADKVSAFSVLVGDNPISNLRSLDGLVGMVTSKVGKRHALTGFEALMELFISSLLPDRKLKNLLQQPLGLLPETKDGYSLLLFWYWEDCLKQRYERFIFALEEASRDMLPVLKHKALKTIYILLKSKSEQERRLLSALVNKLGDPETKSASNADFHLSNLLSDHPNMKAVVIDEVDSFLFRPHLGFRAKYHAINFLSQIRLSQKGDGPKVAKRLVDIYFALFKVLITEASDKKNDKSSKEVSGSKPGRAKNKKMKKVSESHFELDSRLLSVLLTGVNRAFPFVSSSEADDIIEVQTPTLFQLVHSKSFNVAIQALMLLDKISSKNQIVSDRFYRALYAKLLLPAAVNSSKADMFFGLLLRAMKADVSLKRVAAFAKRLLQLALQQPPQYACGCLFLLSEVLKARPPLWNMMLQDESADEEFEYFEDVVEDTDNTNKPIIEPTSGSDDARLVHSNETDSDSDSAEEKNASPDVSSEDDESEAEDLFIRKDSEVSEKSKVTSGEKEQQHSISKKSLLPGGYDPRHSDPSFCNADQVSWWELVVLASHVHPSVATMATTLLSGANIVYNGNPLNDLSLTSFLDKFMEKKPKSSTWHGASQIEPAKKVDMEKHLVGPEILSLAEVDVPPEDLVFHKFYAYKMNSSTKPKKKKKKKRSEIDDSEGMFDIVGDDKSDDEEIDDMLDSANLSDGDYDYEDLDQVANQDDEDLVGGVSDGENDDALSDTVEDFASALDDDLSDGDEDVNIGDVDDEIDVEDERFDERKRKRKSGKKGVSPFASLEEYEHLLNEDSPNGKASAEKKTEDKKEEEIIQVVQVCLCPSWFQEKGENIIIAHQILSLIGEKASKLEPKF